MTRNARNHAQLLQDLADIPTDRDTLAAVDDIDAFSVEEFCRRHRISVQVFYKRRNLMPATFMVGTRRLISREAAAAWRRDREREAAITPA
jgi:hypothetical protein